MRIGAMIVFSSSLAFQTGVPPVAARRPAVDVYHGVEVTDDYRWLEDGTSAEVKAWAQGQNRVTRAYLDTIPFAPRLREKIRGIVDQAAVSYDSLDEVKGRWFALKRDPAKQQPILVALDSLGEKRTETVLVDPARMDSRNLMTIDWFRVSPDARWIAVSMSKAGSESGDLHLFDAASGQAAGEMIERVNGGTAGGDMAWTPDSKGFYYTRYPRTGERAGADLNFYQQVWFHRLGSQVSEDRYETGKDAPRIAEFRVACASDGRVLASMQNGDSGEFRHFLKPAGGEWREVARYADRLVQVVLAPEGDIVAISRKGAPRGKIVRFRTDASDARVVVPEGEGSLESNFFGRSPLAVASGRIYAVYQTGGPQELRVFSSDGKRLKGPEQLPVSSVDGLTPTSSGGLVFSNTSYLTPRQWRQYSAKPGKTLTLPVSSKAGADFTDIEAVRETAVSRDGTKVPLTIFRRKGIKLDGSHPALLTGYGGFGVSLSPGYNPVQRVLFDQGFVFAIANLRGGGEFGEQWHEQGRLTHKQNVFDDFAAAMRHMVSAGYTAPGRLAIQGGSNGGLLMGAALTQHPELCRAVVARVGIYDMLRVELTPNGEFNTVEYGTVKEADQFRALYAYSPYHHVKNGVKYPAVLFMTGENDPRVDPMHSRKMTARLQAATQSGRPVFLRIDADSGHGAGTRLDSRIQELTDTFAFIMDQLGVAYR